MLYFFRLAAPLFGSEFVLTKFVMFAVNGDSVVTPDIQAEFVFAIFHHLHITPSPPPVN